MSPQERLTDILRDVLLLPEDEPIAPDAILYDELGLTSMDLLDLIFRIEEEFGVSIPPGTVARLVRGALPLEGFAVDGVLTEPGRAALADFVEHPLERFPPPVEVASLPRYLNLNALIRLIERLQCA